VEFLKKRCGKLEKDQKFMDIGKGKEIHRYQQEEELSFASADFIIEKARRAIETRGRFDMACTGAFTALDTYRHLSGKAEAKGVDWLNVYIFWSDERCVPPNQPASHYRMVHTNLLSYIPITNDNVHPIQCEEDPKREAELYERILRTHFAPQSSTLFDLVILGLGTEGQVGSLYPQSKALEENGRWVVADFIQDLGEWRVTLTPFAMNRSACVLILARGKEQSEAVNQSLQQGLDTNWPASYIRPEGGEVHWFMDEAAAILL
jgi:6-phosphogluconolactonase